MTIVRGDRSPVANACHGGATTMRPTEIGVRFSCDAEEWPQRACGLIAIVCVGEEEAEAALDFLDRRGRVVVGDEKPAFFLAVPVDVERGPAPIQTCP